MSAAVEREADARPCIGVSACLVGEMVRHDGGHKRQDLLLERLGPHVRWLPLCPEVEAGLGVPRPPIRLEEDAGRVRLVGVRNRRDHTEAMARCARGLLVILQTEGVCGFVLKSRSPTCGTGDAPLHDRSGRILSARDGAFAEALGVALPHLPLASDETLSASALRESFLARVGAYAAFARVRAGEASLCSFHRRHRLLVEARGPGSLPRLRTLRDGGEAGRYAEAFFDALRSVPDRDGHERVLHHVGALVGHQAPSGARRRIDTAVDAYANGATTLRAAVEALAGAVERYGIVPLAGDAYLHPGELRLNEYESL